MRLSHSNLFQLEPFELPLSQAQLSKFQNKELFSTVLLEVCTCLTRYTRYTNACPCCFQNVPQLFVQLFVLWSSASFSEADDIVYASMFFSAMSIMSAIWGICVQRDIVRRTGYVCVEFEVVDQDVSRMHSNSRRVSAVRKAMAALLVLPQSLVEVLRPTAMRDGMRLRLHVYISYTRSVDMNIASMLEQAVQNGEVADMMRAAWRLQNMPLIRALHVQRHESKERRLQEVQLGAVYSVSDDDVPMAGGIAALGEGEGSDEITM